MGENRRAKKECRKIGCRELVTAGYCPAHEKGAKRVREERRESSNNRGYDSSWRRERVGFLRRYPLCRICLEAGRVVPATEIDHIIPHRGDRALFWDRSNWQALCKSCHSSKTARGL